MKKALLVINRGLLRNKNTGFSLIEVLLAISVFSILISVMVVAPIYGEQTLAGAGIKNQAVFLAEEGLEAVRNLRDENYNNLVPGSYGLTVNSSAWELAISADVTEIYTRIIDITAVDASTTEVVSTVTWQWPSGVNNSVSLSTYLTKYK